MIELNAVQTVAFGGLALFQRIASLISVDTRGIGFNFRRGGFFDAVGRLEPGGKGRTCSGIGSN